jgi:hypothetical protein
MSVTSSPGSGPESWTREGQARITVKCGGCGHSVAYLPEHAVVSALEPDGEAWRTLAAEAVGGGAQTMRVRVELVPADA